MRLPRIKFLIALPLYFCYDRSVSITISIRGRIFSGVSRFWLKIQEKRFFVAEDMTAVVFERFDVVRFSRGASRLLPGDGFFRKQNRP
jgi:hypothetical protein